MAHDPRRGDLVSCQSVQVYLRYLQSLGLDDEELLAGLAYPPHVLRDPDARIDYDTFRAVSRRFSAMFPEDPEAAYRAGVAVPELRSLGYIVFVLAMRLEPAIIFGLTPRMVERQFPMIRAKFSRTGVRRCRLEYRYADGYEPFPELEAVARGLMEATPGIAGLAHAKVNALTRANGFDLDIRWDTHGRFLPRLRAATLGRLSTLRDAMTALESAKDRVEQQLHETQQASRRIEALLAVGRAVERGLDVGPLVEAFTSVARQELDVRVLHLCLFDDNENAPSWHAAVMRLSEPLGKGPSPPMDPPPQLVSLPLENEFLHLMPIDGQNGRMGVAFVGAPDNLSARPLVERDLLSDAFNRLGHALGNAFRHRELGTYGEKLERDVQQRTAELAKQAEQLRASNVKLIELDRAKRRFFTHLSHELRTPATLLSASLEEIESTMPEEPTVRRALLRARRNMARVVYAVDDLLDLALLDEGQMTKASEPIDAGAMVRSLVSAVQPWAASNRVTVVAELPEPAPWLVGDARLVEKALLNLVANAVKFSPPGEIVRVVLESEREGVLFRVEDHGPGVTPADRIRVFEAFEQGEHKSLDQGIGIGLSVVQSVASLHGGSVAHAAREPRGSTFSLWLPGCAPSTAEIPVNGPAQPPRARIGTSVDRAASMLGGGDERDARAAQPAKTNECVWVSGEAPSVLIVDDEPEILDVLRRRLACAYVVTTARSGSEALEIVEQAVPSAVLADVSMPGMDGFELCRRLRAAPERSQLPIILLTAFGSVEDKLQGFESGADDYVVKPFSLREVEARLHTQIRLRAMAAEMNAMAGASLMGSVAAGIMHEVNNPLNVLLNALPAVEDAIQPGEDAATVRMLLNLAQTSAQRIHDCVSSISSMASWSKLEPETVDLEELVANVIRQYAQRGGGTTTVSQRGTIGRPIGLLRTEASMVIGNLIANAIDAAGPSGHVEVVLEKRQEHATICIRDDGPGMDAATLSKAREPFYTSKSPGKGMGLGLFIVQQLLRHLGGRLEVRTRVGEGTAMTILLPFAQSKGEW